MNQPTHGCMTNGMRAAFGCFILASGVALIGLVAVGVVIARAVIP